jgi:hypothetical protein
MRTIGPAWERVQQDGGWAAGLKGGEREPRHSLPDKSCVPESSVFPTFPCLNTPSTDRRSQLWETKTFPGVRGLHSSPPGLTQEAISCPIFNHVVWGLQQDTGSQQVPEGT